MEKTEGLRRRATVAGQWSKVPGGANFGAPRPDVSRSRRLGSLNYTAAVFVRAEAPTSCRETRISQKELRANVS